MPRMTMPTLLVLCALIETPWRERYGLTIIAKTGLASGTVYPILARLEAEGWVTSRWESLDPVAAGRPKRRFYEVTRAGEKAAEAARDRLPRFLSAGWTA